MENNTSKLTYMVKSYLSETAIQSWINSRKKDGYKLIFFNTQYDHVNNRIIYTAVVER